MKYQEGDLVICKVTNIVRTTVFVETLDKVKGSIVISEIAPGRIRNLRAYVVPNKIIVCKILDVRKDHLFLSLRRVKNKEKQELIAQHKKERTYESVIKKLLKEKAEETLEEIRKESNLIEFLEKAKDDPKILEKYFNEDQIKSLGKVLQEKKDKIKEIKRQFTLSCNEPNGITQIKKLLKNYENITYLGNSRFVIKRSSKNLKKLDSEITEMFNVIEKSSKKNKCEFHVLKH